MRDSKNELDSKFAKDSRRRDSEAVGNTAIATQSNSKDCGVAVEVFAKFSEVSELSVRASGNLANPPHCIPETEDSREKDGLPRCGWIYQGYNTADKAIKQLYQDYHDFEWGIPQHSEKRLFEQLVLEGMQAGLSWITILKKREAFREAFDDFDPIKVAGYDEAKIESLMANKTIIRNYAKIKSAINNARRFLEVQEEFGSFDSFIWSYVGGKPIINAFECLEEIPTRTPLSDKIAKDLKKRGFSFVGSVGMYAYMQSIGLVCDHLVTCVFHHNNRV